MFETLYLASFEPPNAYTVRAVEYLKPLSCGARTDYVWARVEPAFEPRVFMTEDTIEYVILASRHAGFSLAESKEWPVHVYVCVPEADVLPMADTIAANDLRIVNWGLLYPTMQEARTGKL